jgi:phosphoglycolate phosphatase-like HAD superfamily hydrolase
VLLLFDIDGTLLRQASESHARALDAALRAVHGVDSTAIGRGLSPAGRTDPEIARLILLEAGVSAERIDAGTDEVREECCRAYAEMCEADLSDRVAPGIPALLEWLHGQEGVRLALVTGNYEPVARLKLRRADLGGFFEPGQGGFGSDAEDRISLPAIARRRAGEPGVPFARARTVVIGDTPRDIACAHADGLRCVAVSTGPFAADQLRDADFVAESPAAVRAALETVLDGSLP